MRSIHSLTIRYRKGFTLVEILVSLFILGTALVGVFGLLVYNLTTARIIKNNFIASLLTQEGMEVVRNIHDTDWFLHQTFGTSLPPGTYRVQWDSSALMALGSNPKLSFDSTTGLYQYATGTQSKFTRTITITDQGAVEKRIVVSVAWTDGLISNSVSAETHLFAWF